MVVQLLLCAFSPLFIYLFIVAVILRKVPAFSAFSWITGGLLTVIPVVAIQYCLSGCMFSGFAGVAFRSFIVASGTEELCKFFSCGIMCRRWYNKRRSAGVMGENNGIAMPLLASVTAGLAFGGFETAIYGITVLSSTVLLLRIITAVLLHGASCIIHTSALFAKRGYSSGGINGWYTGSLFVWCFHGLYNMFLIANGPHFTLYAYVTLTLIIIMAVRSAVSTSNQPKKY